MGHLSCREFAELVTDYFEGVLDADTTARFDAHRALCPGCETYLQQIQETVSRLGEMPVESLSQKMQAMLLSGFRDLRR
jgi:hypothetical protein